MNLKPRPVVVHVDFLALSAKRRLPGIRRMPVLPIAISPKNRRRRPLPLATRSSRPYEQSWCIPRSNFSQRSSVAPLHVHQLPPRCHHVIRRAPTAHRELSPHLLLSDLGSHLESPAPAVQHHRRARRSSPLRLTHGELRQCDRVAARRFLLDLLQRQSRSRLLSSRSTGLGKRCVQSKRE